MVSGDAAAGAGRARCALVPLPCCWQLPPRMCVGLQPWETALLHTPAMGRGWGPSERDLWVESLEYMQVGGSPTACIYALCLLAV